MAQLGTALAAGAGDCDRQRLTIAHLDPYRGMHQVARRDRANIRNAAATITGATHAALVLPSMSRDAYPREKRQVQRAQYWRDSRPVTWS